jgi:glycosyltransferase involved in cell wall biosynthesis
LFIPEIRYTKATERSSRVREALGNKYKVYAIDPINKRQQTFGTNRLLQIAEYLYEKIMLVIRSYRVAKLKKIDLIFCEGAPYALVGVIVSRLIRKPCIWDSHGNIIIFCRNFKKSPIYSAVVTLMEKWVGKRVAALITVSEVDKRAYIEMGVEAAKIYIIPISIDLGEISYPGNSDQKLRLRQKLGLPPDKKLLLFFGNIKYAPNSEAVEFINNKLAPVIEKRYDDVEILVIGYTKESPSPPSNPSRIVGFMNFRPNIYDYILASDISIAPLWTAFGVLTKVVDSLACGKPTIVTHLAGIPELVSGQNTMIASNPKEFIEKTLYLLNNQSISEKLGREGRKIVEQHYDWRRCVNQIFEVIEEVHRCSEK